MSLSPPPRYFPIERGLYEVTAGLKPLGTRSRDFENGIYDSMVFQFDGSFREKRQAKLTARRENLQKYHGLLEPLPAEATASAVHALIQRLVTEWPAHFEWDPTQLTLSCRLTAERLWFNAGGELLEVEGGPADPPYLNAFDALACQFSEDCALLVEGSGDGKTVMLHVCSPSHWAPAEKLGLSFLEMHGPVPHFERVAKAMPALLDAMVSKGPYVRFVWSFVTDTRLNHHPVAPPGADPVLWRGRSFDSSLDTPFYLRVERQVTLPLPESRASLFFIGLSFLSGATIRDNVKFRTQLLSALRSMSREARLYKGVEHCFDELTQWLEA